MSSRLDLQTLLENLLESRNVYYRPPESVKMKYPAIVYSLDDIKNTFANNQVYRQKLAYKITVIDPDPDSPLVSKISTLPHCRFVNQYVSDNLNHTVFILNF